MTPEETNQYCKARYKLRAGIQQAASELAAWLRDYDAHFDDDAHERACDAFAHLMVAARLLRGEE